MKTLQPLVAVAALSFAACSAAPPPEEPVESSDEALTAHEKMSPIREAVFAADTKNEVWFVCRAGTGGYAVTFSVSSDGGSDYRVSAVYKKASFYTGYVDSSAALGKATLAGAYPHRIFSFKIGKEAARIEANLPDGGNPFLLFQGKKTKLACNEYDAPYSVDDPFGPPP